MHGHPDTHRGRRSGLTRWRIAVKGVNSPARQLLPTAKRSRITKSRLSRRRDSVVSYAICASVFPFLPASGRPSRRAASGQRLLVRRIVRRQPFGNQNRTGRLRPRSVQRRIHSPSPQSYEPNSPIFSGQSSFRRGKERLEFRLLQLLRTHGRTAEQNNVAVRNAVIGRCYVGKRHLSAAAAGAFGDCFGHFFGISRARPIYYVYHTIKSVPLGKNHRYRAATLLMWLRVQGLGFAFTALPVEGEFTGYRFHLFVSPFVPHFMPEYPWLMPGARTQKKRSHGRTRANFDIFCSRKVSVLRIRRRTF